MSANIKTIHGGNRLGAGRKVGTGKFGEPTEVLRVPSSQKTVISDFLQAYQRKQAKVGNIVMASLRLKHWVKPRTGCHDYYLLILRFQ